MQIINNRLHDDAGAPVPFRPSPNTGGLLTPQYVIIHFTAGRNAAESVNWLVNPISKASAHVVIGRDGSITQLVPFNQVAWHAGQSRWEGLVGLNRHSIGIELDNAGRLSRRADRWEAWFGDVIPDAEVTVATHKNETEARGWHTYTVQQVEAAVQLASLLVQEYNLQDVLGHEDIAPIRKSDPGPAFRMDSFRARVVGRSEDQISVFETVSALNVRSGPGTQNPALEGSPVPAGTRLEVLRQTGLWWEVDVIDEVNGLMDMQGWVHSRFLRRARAEAIEQPAVNATPGLTRAIAWGQRVGPDFKSKVLDICQDLEIDPDFLMASMAFETGATFDPAIKNAAGSGAVGLIQFMPSTATDLGTSTQELAAMTAVEQLDFVAKYFAPRKGRLKTLEDVYMAILLPSAIGKPNEHVLFKKPSKTYNQNKGLDANQDGAITKAEAAAKVRAQLQKGQQMAG